MKKFISLLITLIAILGFTTNVYASATSTIYTNETSTTKYEYVEGVEIYKNYASSYNLYILNKDTKYAYRDNLSDPIVADEGFAYIINNSNVTSSSDKNYYIAQVAILWFQDYLNGNDLNISSNLKTKIKNNTSDTVCYYINKLVEGAKNYSEDDSAIKIIDKEIEFTKSGSYYYSNVIDVETDNLRSTPSITLKNAPSSASVINNTVTKNGNGSFQVRIPISSVTNYDNEEFLIEIIGSGYDSTLYKYTKYGTDAAIYGRVYSDNSDNEEASMIAKLEGVSKTNVRINVLDENSNYINGLKYEIYSGDCSNKTCNKSNLVTSFTTKNTYQELNNVLDEGTYTLVNKSNYEYYNLPEKKVIKVLNTLNTQQFIIENDEEIAEEKTFYITNTSKNNKVIIYIKDDFDKTYDSFKESNSNYKVSLYPGSYSIVASNDSLEVFFDITEDGELYVHELGEKVNRESIDLDNYYKRYTTNLPVEDNEEIKQEEVKEETQENITYDENGNITIDNLDNIESIEIQNKVDTKTEVKVEWLSNIIDCPITSLSSTIKYVIGAIILSIGTYLVVRNVKKSKNNI